MSQAYFNAVIPLKAGVKKVFPCHDGSSFVLNQGTSNVTCKVNGKQFKLRESQVQNHSEERFQTIELTSDIDQDVDIRFGTGGMVVSPPQKEFVNLAGTVQAALEETDIQEMAVENEKHHVSKQIEDLTDVTVPTHATNTPTLCASDATVLRTIVQRIDTENGVVRVGGGPASNKGLEMITQDVLTIDGSGEIKAWNNTGNSVKFAIIREKKA